MLKGNEAFSRVVIDAQLADQGWNTQDRANVREYRQVLDNGYQDGKGLLRKPLLGKTIDRRIFALAGLQHPIMGLR